MKNKTNIDRIFLHEYNEDRLEASNHLKEDLIDALGKEQQGDIISWVRDCYISLFLYNQDSLEFFRSKKSNSSRIGGNKDGIKDSAV